MSKTVKPAFLAPPGFRNVTVTVIALAVLVGSSAIVRVLGFAASPPAKSCVMVGVAGFGATSSGLSSEVFPLMVMVISFPGWLGSMS